MKEFISSKNKKYEEEFFPRENLFDFNIRFYKESLPDFENEILQVITTTDQATIDSYFIELIGNATYIRKEFALENIVQTIKGWNDQELKSFNEEVEKNSEIFFSNNNRKMRHLEEYEIDIYNYYNPSANYHGNIKQEKRVNYNFFCIEKLPDLIDEIYCASFQAFLVQLEADYFAVASKYLEPYSKGEIKSKVEKAIFIKPVVFVEGEHDITYLKKAAELLKQSELLSKVDLRQRGGASKLDKIWDIYQDDNWETIPQKKLLLYDCDIIKQDDSRGYVSRRIIKTISDNIITKGIENLFPNSFIQKAMISKSAFVDIISVTRTVRGVKKEETTYKVNEDEKKNLSVWICEHGTAEDFVNFNSIFKMIEEIIQS